MNSLDIDEYFKETSPDSLSRIQEKIFKDLIENKVSLDKILESLESNLISKEIQKRSKSIKFLNELIVTLPNDYLNSIEIESFASFLCSKLEDHYSVSIPSLPALKHLLQKQNTGNSKSFISKEKSITIIKSILRDIHVQSMVQSDRYLVFSMCKYVLSSSSLVEQIIGEKYSTDFVYGFVQAMDGEKDPRNLLICFDCIQLMCLRLNLGPFVEETFEVFACYFPIDFSPPKNENFTITKEMLISSLRNCFSSKKEFSKFSIPLLLEKLHSSVEESHVDAMKTFSQCSRESYDPNDYKEYIESLWSFFQKTVLNTSKTSLEEAALEAIEALAFSISHTVQEANCVGKISVSIDTFTEKAMQNPVNYLNEPDLKLVWPSVKCLHALARSSSTANLIVNKKCIPLLIHYFKTTAQQTQKKTYLDIIFQFVENSRKIDKRASKVIKENIDDLLQICIENESNKHLNLQCLNGLHQILCFEGLIDQAQPLQKNMDTTETNYYFIAKTLWHSLWLLDSKDAFELSVEKKKMIEIYYLMDKRDDSILDWLIKSIDETFKDSSSQSYLLSLEMLKFLSTLIIADLSLPLTRLDLPERMLCLLSNYLLSLDLKNTNLKFLLNVLEGFGKTIENFSKNKDAYDSIKILDSIMYTILKIVGTDYNQILFESDNNGSRYEIILRFAFIFRVYATNMKSSEKSIEFLKAVDETFSQFKSDEKDISIGEKMTMNILVQIFSNLDKRTFKYEIEEQFIHLKSKLVNYSTEINLNESKIEQGLVNKTSSQFYAALLNKLDNDVMIDEEMNSMKHFLSQIIESDASDSTDKRLRCLDLWIWITKALVLREHKTAEFFMLKLIEWLDILNLSENCSEAFGTILNNEVTEYSLMTNKSASNSKLFYRQRFFDKTIHPLKKKFDLEADPFKKINYMAAIMHMLNYLPKTIVEQHIKVMMPVLLYSLTQTETKNKTLLHISLKSFEILINELSKDNRKNLLEFIDQILENLLVICLYKEDMQIRFLALKCINNLAINISPNKIIKYQKSVCKQLGKCLSDKKRICRQLAVEARNRWFLITTKTNEE